MKRVTIRRAPLVLALLVATLGEAGAQGYQAPKPFDVHEPRGNDRLRVLSYSVDADLLIDEVPLKAIATVSVNNASPQPASEINFYLHPELSVKTVVDDAGTPLTFEARKVEFWPSTTLLATEVSTTLPNPLSPGETADVTLTYEGPVNNSTARGSRSDGYIGIFEDRVFLRLFGYTPWLPLVATTMQDGEDMADFDLEVETPSSLRVIAPGQRQSEEVSEGRRRAVWSTLRPMTLVQHKLWAEPWEVLSEGSLRAYHHGSEAAAQRYLKTCAEIRRWCDRLYGAGLPTESLSAPYSVAQLSLPSGGYPSQYSVGFASKDFTGEFSYADLRWIAHEMVTEYLDVPADVDAPGAMAIGDGFNLFFNLPVIARIAGPEFKAWDLEWRWKRYESGLAGRTDGEGPMPPDKPLAEITAAEYMLYKDRFLTADKEQIVLWRLMDLIGEEAFLAGFSTYLEEHRARPASLEAFREALSDASGQDLTEYFHRWFFTTERLPQEWRLR